MSNPCGVRYGARESAGRWPIIALMAVWVAFLRAVNLGATRRFAKEAMVDAATAAGFTGVQTYLASGNVRLETTVRSPEKVEAALEAAFAAAAGFPVPTIAVPMAQLRTILADAVSFAHPGAQFVAVAKTVVGPDGVAALEARATGRARAEVRGRAIHLLLDEDYLHSPFTSDVLDRAVGVTTTRNLTVITQLVRRWGS